jgi:hypothetical protein
MSSESASAMASWGSFGAPTMTGNKEKNNYITCTKKRREREREKRTDRDIV